MIAFLLLAFLLVPTIASPACSPKHSQQGECAKLCKSGWGWSSKATGTNTWGAKNPVLSTAPGSASTPSVLPTTTPSKSTPTPHPISNKTSTSTTPPAKPTTTTTSAQDTASTGSTSAGDVKAYLSAHNSVRAQHGAADLTWSNDLANKAQQWANGCKFVHSGGPTGENLAAGTGDYSIQAAVKAWTDEASQYDSSNPQPSHFTQVVWKSTKQVGCAVQSCDGIFDPSYGKAQYYVCEYDPAGNVDGEYAQNVQA